MKKKNISNRFGSTTVELALTLPIFFLLLFGFYELSRANLIIHTAEAAAYEGARIGIIPGATSAEVTDAVNAVLDTVAVNNAQVSVTPANLDTDSELVAVTVEINFGDNSSLIPQFIADSTRFERTCELIRELNEQ